MGTSTRAFAVVDAGDSLFFFFSSGCGVSYIELYAMMLQRWFLFLAFDIGRTWVYLLKH